MRIFSRGNKSGGFMQHDGKSRCGANKFAIDFDMVLCAWLCAEVRADLAVDSNATCSNKPITMSSRTDAGSGEKTVQAQGELTKVTSIRRPASSLASR